LKTTLSFFSLGMQGGNLLNILTAERVVRLCTAESLTEGKVN